MKMELMEGNVTVSHFVNHILIFQIRGIYIYHPHQTHPYTCLKPIVLKGKNWVREITHFLRKCPSFGTVEMEREKKTCMGHTSNLVSTF